MDNRCGKVINAGINSNNIKEIVEAHNKYRARIANGEEWLGSPGPQPGASNMQEMVWDAELATVAQKHADQCVFEHDCSDCRRVQRFRVGQNLYIYKQTIRSAPVNWKRAIASWYDEVKLFSKFHVSPFKFSHETGHYSQLLWADTTLVGCGATTFREGRWFSTLYTCNYGPGGNVIRGKMYRQGRACSDCPKGTQCSSKYPGLCKNRLSKPEQSKELLINSTRTTLVP